MDEMNDDATLVAFVDGRLDGDAARALRARLAGDAALGVRLALIRDGGALVAPAFQALLATAPVDAMQNSLARMLSAPAARARRREPLTFWTRGARVAAALALIAVGIAIGRLAPTSFTGAREDWRDAVAEYSGLYTARTFADTPPDAARELGDLARLGGEIGFDLPPDRIALANARFRGVQILNYNGAPLGQIAYVDPTGVPIFFCIIANGQPDAALQKASRGNMSMASWASGGRGYVVIARAPQAQVAEMAAALKPRF